MFCHLRRMYPGALACSGDGCRCRRLCSGSIQTSMPRKLRSFVRHLNIGVSAARHEMAKSYEVFIRSKAFFKLLARYCLGGWQPGTGHGVPRYRRYLFTKQPQGERGVMLNLTGLNCFRHFPSSLPYFFPMTLSAFIQSFHTSIIYYVKCRP